MQKFSFSLPSKSTSTKPNLHIPSQNFDANPNRNDQDDSKVFVSEFDPTKPLTDNKNTKKLVIPPIQNEWRPLKKMKNLELPLSQSDGTDLRFELESPSLAQDGNDSKMSYGLNLRQEAAATDAASNGDDESESRVANSKPASVESVLLQKLKDDLKRLPEDRGFEEFEEVPVEGFGAALLAGYGWFEGRGIGKNAKEDVKVVQYEKRTDKQGLGFFSDPHPSHKKEGGREKGRERERDREKVREEKERDDDRQRDSYGLIGNVVRIVGGRDAGLKGKVMEKLSHDFLVLKLSTGEQHLEVKVHANDVAELGSQKEERFLKKSKEAKIQGVEKDERKVHRRTRDVEQVVKKQERDMISGGSRREEELRSSQMSWLANHIRVRIISKDFKGGRFYRRKGEIVDVVGSKTCDISMDEGRELIQGVSQDLLETALPKRGGSVLILYGKHKGVYGSLVERDLEQETGIVRDADSHALLNVRLDQVAEFVGDPSYLGY